MSFEEVQAIWKSHAQSNTPLDSNKLRVSVVEKTRSFHRVVNVTELLMFVTLIFVAAMFFRDPLLQGHDLVLIFPGIACIAAAVLVWQWRINRQRRQTDFNDSLMGVIDKSIDSIEEQIALMRRFLWLFALP